MVKNLPGNAGDAGLIPGLGRSPGEGNGYLLQYSCLENPMDRGAWRAIVHGVAKSWTRLSTSICVTFKNKMIELPSVLSSKESTCMGLIPGPGRFHILWSNRSMCHNY